MYKNDFVINILLIKLTKLLNRIVFYFFYENHKDKIIKCQDLLIKNSICQIKIL